MGTRVLKKISVCLSIVFLLSINPVESATNFEYFFGNDNSKYQDVVVKKVISVDTFIIEGGEKIKLIGLKAPEVSKVLKRNIQRDKNGFVIQPKQDLKINQNEVALDFVKGLLEGQHIRLEFDAEKKDKDYKTLAYGFLLKNDMFINSEILRKGFSYLQIIPPNLKYAKKLRLAYQEARKEKRGMQGE